MPLPIPIPAPEVLDREFLEVRAKLLQIAATFDRLERAKGEVAANPRLKQIQDGLRILLDGDSDRTERMQTLFSLPYREHWKEEFGLGKEK